MISPGHSALSLVFAAVLQPCPDHSVLWPLFYETTLTFAISTHSIGARFFFWLVLWGGWLLLR